MAVGTERYQVRFGVNQLLTFEVGYGLGVMNMNVAGSIRTICLTKIETTCLASQAVDCDSLSTQLGISLVSHPKVECSTSFNTGDELFTAIQNSRISLN